MIILDRYDLLFHMNEMSSHLVTLPRQPETSRILLFFLCFYFSHLSKSKTKLLLVIKSYRIESLDCNVNKNRGFKNKKHEGSRLLTIEKGRLCLLVKVSFEKSLSFPVKFLFSFACTSKVDTKLFRNRKCAAIVRAFCEVINIGKHENVRFQFNWIFCLFKFKFPCRQLAAQLDGSAQALVLQW